VSTYYRSATIRQASERHLSEADSPRQTDADIDEDKKFFFGHDDKEGEPIDEKELHFSIDEAG